MDSALLSSAYLAPVQYYTKLYQAPRVIIDGGEHYEKQTFRNRCRIAGADGAQTLTLPVEKTDGRKVAIRDIRLSDHGGWPRQHWQALRSAYEHTPFFDYYADDFLPFYTKPFRFLWDFNEGLRQTVCDLLDIRPALTLSEAYVREVPDGYSDFRRLISPKYRGKADPGFRPAVYYQVFGQRHGFLPNLSVADLLFNMGPESRIILRDSCVTPIPS